MDFRKFLTSLQKHFNVVKLSDKQKDFYIHGNYGSRHNEDVNDHNNAYISENKENCEVGYTIKEKR